MTIRKYEPVENFAIYDDDSCVDYSFYIDSNGRKVLKDRLYKRNREESCNFLDNPEDY